MKSVADPEIAAKLAEARAVLAWLHEADISPDDHRDAHRLVRTVEAISHQVGALKVSVMDRVETQQLYAQDGFLTVKSMVRNDGRLSGAEASRRVSMMKALRSLPELKTEFENGRVGACQVQRLARSFSNKRIRDEVQAAEPELVRLARQRPYDEFDALVSDFERLADEDGVADKSEANHRRRNFRIHQEYNGGFSMDGQCGSVEGAQIEEILQHFEHSEFLADWEHAEALFGEGNVTKDMLRRTDAQRRADAHLAALKAGACNPEGGGKTTFVTNIVQDHTTFERECQRLWGHKPDADDTNRANFESRTINGRLIDPAEAAAAAIVYQFRRAVIGADGVVINMSRRSRFFKGSSRLAVQLTDTQCCHVGCQTPADWCQVDHMTPWSPGKHDPGGGRTDPGNGALACGPHNRFHYHSGYRTHRDQRGQWRTYRPDGTLVA